MDFEIFWGLFGDDLGMLWVGPWHVLARKNRLIQFFKKSFFFIGVSCAEKSRKVRSLVLVQKQILIQISVPAWPAGTAGLS